MNSRYKVTSHDAPDTSVGHLHYELNIDPPEGYRLHSWQAAEGREGHERAIVMVLWELKTERTAATPALQTMEKTS